MEMRIFFQERDTQFPSTETVSVTLVDSALVAAKSLWKLRRRLGYFETGKVFLRSFYANRLSFYHEEEGGAVCSGTIAIGFCRHYEVTKDAVVLGSIGTESTHRGRGLATATIKQAMNLMISRGYKSFYIDTLSTNIAMLRSIDKLGFGRPQRCIDL